MATSVMASGGHQLTVSAVVLSKSNCKFTTGSASISLAIDVMQTVTLSATVAPADFQDALPGAYPDQITLSLLP